jgi:hypothetical protein
MPGTAAAHHPDAYDPLDDAMAPPEPGRFWGEVRDIEIHSVGFRKKLDENGNEIVINGKTQYERPEPYNPDVHGWESKQIKFILAPLDTRRKFNEQEFGLNNRSNPEFRRIVQPSILALGPKICQLRDIEDTNVNYFRQLIGLFVFGEYVKRPWNKEDEDWATLKFCDVFATADECEAHQAAMREQDGQAQDEALPFPGDEPQAPPPAADPQRAAMAAFLPALWLQAAGNKAAFLSLINTNPMLAEHFNADSPEVIRIANESVPF